ADVYLDSLYVGKSNQVIKDIPYGEHLLKIEKPGFAAHPPRQKIIITKDSAAKIDVTLVRNSEVQYGFLKIEANVNEAQLYIDEEYLGNLKDYPIINLSSGRHKVEVKKDFYKADPQFNWVNISAHDTTSLPVELKLPEQKTYQIKAARTRTYLEVFSNVTGAIIILNDQPTTNTTDYVFTDLESKKYKVQLYKKGFEFSPEYVNLDLRKGSSSQRVRFEGELVINEANISIIPATAQIVIDGKARGQGVFSGNLSLGKHTLNIIAPEGYANYVQEEIEIVSGIPYEKEISLVPYFTYGLYIDDRGNLKHENCRSLNGYFELNRGFSYSGTLGPELVYEESLNNYIWKMGYAYPYRTPMGNDGIRMKFDFNYNLNLLSNVKLIIYAGVSEERYPKTFSSNSSWRVTLNNYKLHEIQQINDKGQPGQLVKFVWDVTNKLKYAENTVEISTTDDNEVFFFIKNIIVTNK
ncbi:MAG: PEGA domain-containing protein, partial [Calditrichia bacterium]|nr:PEGA domain-containing protein [Calditrichia bacterium]